MKYFNHKIIALFILMLVVLPGSNTYAGTTKNVAVVYKENSSTHRNILASIKDTLQKFKSHDINLNVYSIDTVNQKNILSNYDLVVTVGTAPAAKIMALKVDSPILNIAIPKLTLEQLKIKYKVTSHNKIAQSSAIYLDQPIYRNFDLIQTILPNAKHVGIVMGPIPVSYKNDLKHELNLEIKNRGIKIHPYEIKKETEIIDAVDKALENSDVLLGHIDQLVFNRKSARNILLTSYRWKVPVIGISPGYVRAGALACVYSSPEQIGQHAAETIRDYFKSYSLKKPQYPKYFSVSANYQVAEAMGIYLKSEKQIKETILRARGDASWSE